MLKSYIVAYPWDLFDEGIDVVLDKLQGEVGVDGLSLWVATPSVTQLRIRDVEPRLIRTQGGLCFQPSEKHYTTTRVKPAVAEWLGNRDALALIADACEKHGLELRVKISAACAGPLALNHPEAACKNVFGSVSDSSVCLANPDVQAYLCGLASDLSANHRAAGLCVEDFTIAWLESPAGELGAVGSLGWAALALLSLCFCESCRQKAAADGVDVDEVIRFTSTRAQKYFDNGRETEDTVGDVLADNAELAKFYDWRAGEMSTLLKRMGGAFDGKLLLARYLAGAMWGEHSGLDVGIPDAVITRLDEIDELDSAMCTEARSNELCVPASFAYEPHAPELVSMVSAAAELGFAGVEIDHYGQLPDAAFTAVKQAIRFAKRSTVA